MASKKYLLLIACLILLVNNAQAEDTCPNKIFSSDRDFWNLHSYMSEQSYRDMFADYYNLQKDDWDEGWGWAKYNDPDPYQYTFPKMMIAGQLLWSGIDDSLSFQGAWSARVWFADTSTNRRLKAVSRTADTIDLIYRDSSDNLQHAALSGGTEWYPGTFPPNRVVSNISFLVRTEKDNYRITGDPIVLSRTVDSLDVFARSSDNLLHFSWTATAGWTVENLTALTVRPVPFKGRDRYFINSDPVAVSRSQDTIDVFAVDDFHHLIHYSWSIASGWQAEDLTQVTSASIWVKSDPVIAIRSSGSLDVFVRSTPENRVWDKHLVHFFWSSGSSWQVEDLTQRYGSTAEIEGVPTVTTRTVGEMDVFARKDYHLRHFGWSSAHGWAVEDLTAVTRVAGPCVGGYCTYVIEGDPVALNPPTLGSLNIFARDINGNLIQYFKDASGWHAESISSQFGCFSIAENPVVFSRSSTRIDIVASDLSGFLTHCYWSPELGWKGERPPIDVASIPLYYLNVETSPALISRREDSLDVFALRLGIPQYYAHYTAAIGLTVNPWHRNSEYSAWAAGSLHSFPYTPRNEADLDAAAYRGPCWICPWCRDKVSFGCWDFRHTGPAERASVMLHEATHMNYWGVLDQHEDNIPGVTGTRCSGEPCSDYWIFHWSQDPAGAFRDGIGSSRCDLFGPGYVIDANHSPYQMEVEYDCDIGEFPRWDVPFSVYNGMTDKSNYYQDDSILNQPGWRCGIPRPLR
jgi:hypothetical protein